LALSDIQSPARRSLGDSLAISIVMPVHDGEPFLARSLSALIGLVGNRPAELIVVDDGSTDGSATLAAEMGAKVLPMPARGGPAAARNLGANVASGDVLFFVDADVVVHGDALVRVEEAFADAGVVAVFGSYDDHPADRGAASLYMNLRHHIVHQDGAGEAETFWAGCGAIRRAAFLDAGGFDAARYARPSIEDIELGQRLRSKGGRIRLDPELQATHLKKWTFWSVIRTDILCRALPWARLIHAGAGAAPALNTSRREQTRALLAWSIVASAGLAAAGWLPFWAPIALVGAAALANRRLVSILKRRGGLRAAVAGLLQHQAYYLYSSAVYVYCAAERLLRSRSPAGSG